MSTNEMIGHSERTAAVQSSSYQWAFIVVTYALLIDIAVRAAFRNEAAWDLMAIVIVGGLVCTAYQARQHTLSQNWTWKTLLLIVAVAVFSAVIAAIVQTHNH